MNWPTSQDYNEAIQNSTSFADPTLKSGAVVVNALGLPVPRSGNFADVYEFKGGDGKTWALKCFTRKVAGLQDRYAKIDEHIGKANFPFTVGFNYLAEGIRFRGQWFPLLKMEWVHGLTLNEFVRDNAAKQPYLQALLQMWAKLCARLRDGNFAHADLQHGNVLLVRDEAQNKFGLKLIDYDGMYVPSLAEHHSGEIGHPNFQHPLRLRDRLYNGDADRFPHLVIAAALRATMLGGRALWDQFDNGDNLLFKEADLRDPANAPVFKALWEMKDNLLCLLVGKLALAAKEPMRKTPWLDDLLQTDEGERLSDAEEKKVMDMLGVGPQFTAVKAAAAPAPEANDFAGLEVVEETERPSGAAEAEAPKKKPRKAAKEREPKPAKTKSFLPYYVGGGVAAVALIVGIFALSGGNKKPPPAPPEAAAADVKKNDAPAAKDIGRTQKNDDARKVERPPVKKDRDDPPGEIDKKGPPKVVPPPANDDGPPVLGIAAVPNTTDFLMFASNANTVHRIKRDKTGAVLGNHGNSIRTVACSPDGQKAISGGHDHLLRLFATNSIRQIFAFNGHSQPIVACAFSPDGERAVSVGLDQQLIEWDLKQFTQLGKMKVPTTLAVAYLPDGKSVLLGTKSESALVYSLEGHNLVKELKGHDGAVPAVCVSADSKSAFTGGDDGAVRSWDLISGKQIGVLGNHPGGVVSLGLFNGDKALFSAGADRKVMLWDLSTGASFGNYDALGAVRAVALGGMGDTLVVGTGVHGKMDITHVPIDSRFVTPPVVKKEAPSRGGQLKELWNLPVAGGFPRFTSDSARLVLEAGTSFRLLDAKDGSQVETLKFDKGTNGMRLCADGSALGIRTEKGIVRLTSHDAKTGNRRFEVEDDLTTSMYAVAESAGLIFAPLKQGGVGVYSLKDGKKSGELALGGGRYGFSVECTADGEAVLATAGGSVVFFREAKDRPMRQVANLKAIGTLTPVPRLAPDGKHFIHYDGSDSIFVYETATGKQSAVLAGHAGRVAQAALLVDGRRAISYGADDTLRLWDIDSGKEIARASWPSTNPFKRLAVSPDGRFAFTVTSGEGGTRGRVWAVPAADAPADAPPEQKADGGVPAFKEMWTVPAPGNLFKFTTDNAKIAVVDRGSIQLFDVKDGAALRTTKIQDRPLGIFYPCPDDACLVAVPGPQGRLELAFWGPSEEQRRFTINDTLFVAAGVLPRSNSVITSNQKGGLAIVSLKDGSRIGQIKMPTNPAPSFIDCTPDGEAILTYVIKDIYYRAASASPWQKMESVEAKEGQMPRLRLSPDGKRYLHFFNKGPVVVHETGAGKPIASFDGHTGVIGSAVFTQDGRYVLSASMDKTLRIWDIAIGKEVKQIQFPGWVTGMEISPDGRWLATSFPSGGNMLRLWSIGAAAAPPVETKPTAKLSATNLAELEKMLATSKLAEVAIEGERFLPVKDGMSDGKQIFGEVPPWLQNRSFHFKDKQAGFTHFSVQAQGIVLMAVSPRFKGGGNAAGNWKPECVSKEEFLRDGWHEVGTLPIHNADWPLYWRECKKGESFKLRTEKYLAPIIIK
jgi:WD40 repeat protein